MSDEHARETRNSKPAGRGMVLATPPRTYYGISGSTQGLVIGITPIKALPFNIRRKYILIQNKSAASVFFSFSVVPDPGFFNAHEITSGGSYETETYCLTSDLFIVAAINGLTIVLTEGVRA